MAQPKLTIEQIAVGGALVSISAPVTLPASTSTIIDWDQEEYDTDNIHDISINPSRLTVPIGASYAKIITYVYIPIVIDHALRFYKNTSLTWIGYPYMRSTTGSEQSLGTVTTPWVSVVPGDYFSLQIINWDAVPQNLQTTSWLSMEYK